MYLRQADADWLLCLFLGFGSLLLGFLFGFPPCIKGFLFGG
jgi:hypothetical protein